MHEDHVVEFSNVGKKYRLGEYGATTLGEELSGAWNKLLKNCLLYTSPSPRDGLLARMPSSA